MINQIDKFSNNSSQNLINNQLMQNALHKITNQNLEIQSLTGSEWDKQVLTYFANDPSTRTISKKEQETFVQRNQPTVTQSPQKPTSKSARKAMMSQVNKSSTVAEQNSSPTLWEITFSLSMWSHGKDISAQDLAEQMITCIGNHRMPDNTLISNVADFQKWVLSHDLFSKYNNLAVDDVTGFFDACNINTSDYDIRYIKAEKNLETMKDNPGKMQQIAKDCIGLITATPPTITTFNDLQNWIQGINPYSKYNMNNTDVANFYSTLGLTGAPTDSQTSDVEVHFHGIQPNNPAYEFAQTLLKWTQTKPSLNTTDIQNWFKTNIGSKIYSFTKDHSPILNITDVIENILQPLGLYDPSTLSSIAPCSLSQFISYFTSQDPNSFLYAVGENIIKFVGNPPTKTQKELSDWLSSGRAVQGISITPTKLEKEQAEQECMSWNALFNKI